MTAKKVTRHRYDSRTRSRLRAAIVRFMESGLTGEVLLKALRKDGFMTPNGKEPIRKQTVEQTIYQMNNSGLYDRLKSQIEVVEAAQAKPDDMVRAILQNRGYGDGQKVTMLKAHFGIN